MDPFVQAFILFLFRNAKPTGRPQNEDDDHGAHDRQRRRGPHRDELGLELRPGILNTGTPKGARAQHREED